MKYQNILTSYLFQLFIILMVFFSGGVNAANECSLKFKSNNSPFKIKKTNKGTLTNYSQSKFTAAENNGRNDMELTLEYFDILSQRNKTEKLHLIKSGGVTLYLPPIPLIGKKLKSIRCKNYSTVLDAQNYIRQFGRSVNTLVTNATNTVTQSINNAATQVANGFSSRSANSLKSNAQSAISQVSSTFNRAKNAATSTASSASANLRKNFPEVKEAVVGSRDYIWSIPDTVVAQGKHNITKTLDELKRMDKKYKVSQTATNVVALDLRKNFPEIAAVLDQQCHYDNQTLTRLKNNYKNIQNKMKVLDRKYGLSKNIADLGQTLISLPNADMQKVKRFLKFKKCGQDWKKFAVQFEKDRKAFSLYSNKLIRELKKIDKRVLSSSQRQFAVEIDKLLKASAALSKERKAQNKRELAVSNAKQAHANAIEKVENDLGPIGAFLESLPGGKYIAAAVSGEIKPHLPHWMTRDPARLKANLADAKRKGEAYEKAINAYDTGFDKVDRKYKVWVKQIGITLKQGTRLKVKLPNGSPLWKILKSAPKFRAVSRSYRAMIDCARDFAKLSSVAIGVYVDVVNQYTKNIKNIMNKALPKDVRKALVDVKSAIHQLDSTAFRSISDKDISAMTRSLSKNIASLGNLMKQIPNNSNISSQINNALKLATKQLRDARAAGKSVGLKLVKLDSAFANLAVKGNALNKVIQKHNTSREVTELRLALGNFASTSWSGVKKSVKDTVNCLTQYDSKIGAASNTFFKRFNAVVKNKAKIVANSIPAPVKRQLTKLISDLSKNKVQYGQFVNTIGTAEKTFKKLAASQAQALSSIVPIPKPNAVQKVKNLVSKYNALKQQLADAGSKARGINSSQQKIVADLARLGKELKKLDGELRNEAAKLVFVAFDTSLLNRQSQGLTSVISKWNVAIQKLPERIASLVTGGLSDQVIAQVDRGIQQMNNLNSELRQCVTDAVSKRTSIQSQQRKVQVINQTLSGLSAEATATMVSLQSLLSPSLNLLSKINRAMNSAARLSSRIQSIGNTASSNFIQNVSSVKRELATAKECVISKNSQILSKKTQLLQLLR